MTTCSKRFDVTPTTLSSAPRAQAVSAGAELMLRDIHLPRQNRRHDHGAGGDIDQLHVQAVFLEKPSVSGDPERRVIGRQRREWNF